MNVFVVSFPNGSERKSNTLIRNEFKEFVLFEFQSKNYDLISTYTKSENGFGFKRPGVTTGVENTIFQLEIGSRLGELDDTTPPEIPEHTSPDKTDV